MKNLFNKAKNKIVTAGCRLALKKQAFLAKDHGDATLIVVIAMIVLTIALLVIFKDSIFAAIKTAISNANTNLNGVFNAE